MWSGGKTSEPYKKERKLGRIGAYQKKSNLGGNKKVAGNPRAMEVKNNLNQTKSKRAGNTKKTGFWNTKKGKSGQKKGSSLENKRGGNV